MAAAVHNENQSFVVDFGAGKSFLLFSALTVLALIRPICRRVKIASFSSFMNCTNILVFSYAVMCVFELANTYTLIATCVADVLPACIVAGNFLPEAEVQLGMA